MSAYSLETLNQSKYLEQYEQTLLCEFDKHINQKYFRIGEKIDYRKAAHATRLTNILDTENCKLVNYIQDKIDGGLECKNKRKKQKRRFAETISTKNYTDFLLDCTSLPWCDIEW